MHPLLEKQLQSLFGTSDILSLAEPQRSFARAVETSYQDMESERARLEKTLALSNHELFQANRQMQSLFQALPDILFRLDESGTIVEYRGQGTGDFFRPPQELIGKKIHSIPIRSVALKLDDARRRVQDTQDQISVEYTLPMPQADLEFEARFVPLVDKEVIVIVRNITERKKSVEDLHQQREFLRQVVDVNPNFIFAKDIDGRFTLVNQAVAEAYGTTVENLLGKTDEDFHLDHQECARVQQENLDVIHQLKEKVIWEEPFTDSVGKVRWFLTIKRPILSSNGVAHQVLTVSTDITERRHAEEEIKRTLSLLSSTLESTVDGILVVDLNGKVVTANRKFYEMWKIPDEVASSKDDAKLMACIKPQLSEPELYRRKVKELYARPEAESFDVLHLRDGRIFERNSMPHRVDGKASGRVWSFRDVSEKQRLESQYLRAQRLESIGTLAGGIAHDLNNVFTPILMTFQLLRDTIHDNDTLDILETAETTAHRGAEIVRQVLTFARGSRGERAPLSLTRLMMEIQKIVQETFPKSITMTLAGSDNLWTVLGDATQLHQVMLNLCLNARDAMMPRGGELTLSVQNVSLEGDKAPATAEAKPGPYVQLTVSDTGAGIPPEILDKIFDPFFTTKEPNQGTGIGLSTVLGIVKGHGGFIRVFSVPQKGTLFQIFLPAANQNTAQDPHVEQPALPRGRGEWVLVVDDEPSIRGVTQTALRLHGYHVITAADGQEALRLFAERQGEFQLILMDMNMPVLGGPAALEALQELDPKVKVIATSGLFEGHDDPGQSPSCVRAFLQKPYTPENLLTLVYRVLHDLST